MEYFKTNVDGEDHPLIKNETGWARLSGRIGSMGFWDGNKAEKPPGNSFSINRGEWTTLVMEHWTDRVIRHFSDERDAHSFWLNGTEFLKMGGVAAPEFLPGTTGNYRYLAGVRQDAFVKFLEKHPGYRPLDEIAPVIFGLHPHDFYAQVFNLQKTHEGIDIYSVHHSSGLVERMWASPEYVRETILQGMRKHEQSLFNSIASGEKPGTGSWWQNGAAWLLENEGGARFAAEQF